LKQIKFELNNQYKLSNRLEENIQASKLYCDEFCGELGFIHEVTANPFGFLSLCDKQVNTILIKN
jgi:hypothetical protein